MEVSISSLNKRIFSSGSRYPKVSFYSCKQHRKCLFTLPQSVMIVFGSLPQTVEPIVSVRDGVEIVDVVFWRLSSVYLENAEIQLELDVYSRFKYILIA